LVARRVTNAFVSSVTLGWSSAGSTPDHVRIGFALYDAGEGVAGVAADAAALARVCFVEQ